MQLENDFYKDKRGSSCPVVVYELDKSWVFGLITLWLIKEDRRPDLDFEVNKKEIRELGYKYKTRIKLKVFLYKVSIIIHSINPGFLMINGKEID